MSSIPLKTLLNEMHRISTIDLVAEVERRRVPVPLILHCPECRMRHIDEGEFATKPHHTHSCQACGFTWRPAVVDTVGVRFLPGFKDKP
ncbi:MAG: hypothetical protein K0U16_07685 [Gammaproteobacteria bacterium]|nr:hypothetical protein [Gammaproteobacteria bacterium]